MRVPAVILLLLSGAAWAKDPILSDENYAHQSTLQRDPIRRHVRQILAPTLTFPALGQPGGEVQVLVRLRGGPQLSGLRLDDPAAWVVGLRSASGGTWPCGVQRVRRDEHDPMLRAPLRTPGRRPRSARRVKLSVSIPGNLARDVYDLVVVGPGIDDSQPNAVRLLGDSDAHRFRFAVVTDPQLWDPTSRLGRLHGPGGYPGQTDGAKQSLGMTRQVLAELALWDPDFVLGLGDLVFGVNYPDEYGEVRQLLRQSRLPLFAIPGNHDGYAEYVVRLRGGALKLVAGVLGCRKHLRGDLSWEKAWVFITCVYGDVKNMLYADLHRDGLAYWARQLGPPSFAFDHGDLHFVGINTYGGTAERRHAFSIYMDVFDLHLGAPAVDNHGGYLDEGQLRFVEQQARQARSRGQTLVLFGHHDPRGNPSGRSYHPNEPFPTDPIGMAGLEQWNFDSASWDSNPLDQRANETEQHNSGQALLRILARYGGYYLCGHVHQDSRRVYEPGSRLPGGIEVQRRLEFITTTTAAAAVRGDGYWGYRVIEAADGTLRGVDFDPAHHLSSVPAGNLWSTRDHDRSELSSGLPRAVAPLVRWALPVRAEGYRFRLAAGASPGAVASGLRHPVVERLQIDGKQTTYWLRVSLPPAPQGGRVVRRLRALAARDNHPPRGVIDVSGAGGLKLQPLDPGFDAAPGQPVLLSGERSVDAEGDRIVAYLWELGQDHTARGSRVVHRFATPGPRRIRLTLIDEAGASSTVEATLKVQPPRLPPPEGCGCCSTGIGPASLAPPSLMLLVLLLVHRWRRRRP